MSLLPSVRRLRAPIAFALGLSPLFGLVACGAGGVPRGHFLRVRAEASVCETRTDEDGDGQVDSIVVEHYDGRERVAVEELDQDADGQAEVSIRYAYAEGLLRRVETTVGDATHTRLLEYRGEHLVRETWRDAAGQHHARLYGTELRAAPEVVVGHQSEIVLRTHDAEGRVSTEDRRLANGARTFSTFTYDVNGDRLAERLEHAGQPMACLVDYEHDEERRLRRRVHRLGGTPAVETVFQWRPDGTLARSETRSGGELRQRIDYGEGCRVREVPGRH